MASKEFEQMFSQIEKQQADLKNSIETSKQLAARSDQLIHIARSQKTGQDQVEA